MFPPSSLYSIIFTLSERKISSAFPFNCTRIVIGGGTKGRSPHVSEDSVSGRFSIAQRKNETVDSDIKI